MTKKTIFFPCLMLILFAFSSCQFSRSDVIHGDTIAPNYANGKENFEKDILVLAEGEEVAVSTTVKENNGVKSNYITIEVISNKSSFEDKISLLAGSHRIISEAKKSINNIEDYNKIIVKHSGKSIESGMEKNISFKIEADL